MTTQRLVKTSVMLLLACGVLVPLGSQAYESSAEKSGEKYPYQSLPNGDTYPFPLTADGMETYLNSGMVTWKDNQKIRFFNTRQCKRTNFTVQYDGGDPVDYFDCKVDYEERGSLGRRICANSRVTHNLIWNTTGFDEFDQSEKTCGNWKKVSAEPKIEESQDTPSSNHANSSLNTLGKRDYQLLGAGASLVLLGGGLGLLLSKLINRK
jgi:hypothetical protein